MTFPPEPEKKPSSETMLQTMSLRMVGGQPLKTLRDGANAELGNRPNVAVHPAEGRREAPLQRIGCNSLLAGSCPHTMERCQ
jgi:hypothetical protein